MSSPIIVIGAGLAGLTCARVLHDAGEPVIVIEAADAVGGRIRTDVINQPEGPYRIDRGFQVYLTAYPDAAQWLDSRALEIGTLTPGAMIRVDGAFDRMDDPWRSPRAALAALTALATGSPLMTRGDVVALGALDTELRRASADAIWSAPEESTESLLRGAGISDRAIDRFFRPFFGGVFLDRALTTSARKFRFLYQMFAKGHAALPRAGMQAIPDQLARPLPESALRIGTPVTALDGTRVTLASGEVLDASRVVLATDAHSARSLQPALPATAWSSTISVSFSCAEPPTDEAMLYLDGDGTGPVNHVAVLSNVQPSYAPAGRALISCTIVEPAASRLTDVESAVRDQMREWFGETVESWTHLRTDTIRHALPQEASGTLDPPQRPITTDDPAIVRAGDSLDNASINGAIVSGRRAAEYLLQTP